MADKLDLGKIVAGSTSGYVGVDSALKIITESGLTATLVDPAGEIAMAFNLVLLLASVLYIVAMTGMVEFSGR
jgi:hypothetical protein